MLPSIVRLLRLASILISVIVIVSFAFFAFDQTGSASSHQREQIASGAGASPGSQHSAGSSQAHEGAVRKAIDEASSRLTSPFSAITSGATSEWAIRGAKLLLALVVYGFGLGFLARVLRVRV